MTAILTFSVVGFLVLTVVYVLVSVYSRSVRREKLEKRFDDGGMQGDRDAYIDQGMQAYENGLRRRLVLLVYVIPIAIVLVTVYLVNHS